MVIPPTRSQTTRRGLHGHLSIIVTADFTAQIGLAALPVSFLMPEKYYCIIYL